jgi:hypothetical protein
MSYLPTVNPGDQRERVWRIQGENINALQFPGSVPWFLFHWEKAMRTRSGDPSPENPAPSEAGLGRSVDVQVKFTPGASFQLLNPLTGLPIEGQTMTHEQLFAAVFSLGRSSRLAYDAAAAADEAASAARDAAAAAAEVPATPAPESQP